MAVAHSIGLVWHCDGAVFTDAEEWAENRARSALVGGISLYLSRIFSNRYDSQKAPRRHAVGGAELHGSSRGSFWCSSTYLFGTNRTQTLHS